ncbi:terminase small subunit [Clostridium botulinum]|uniref:terminase small subunit n=1 Tax=Clostridium botulinum TaxID=1491 RepID=UPI003A804ED7
MVDIRGPDWNLIKEEYLKLNGNVKLKEFAEEHGVKYSTLRSRKNRENWDSEINENVATKSATQQKNVATENKNKNNKEEPIAEEVTEVMNNPELTDKQRLFCVYYPKYFNATKAAIKAGYSKNRASEIGYQLLQKTKVQNEIKKLKANKLNKAMLEPEDIFQKFMDIAFSDVTDYITFGRKEIEVDKNEDGESVMSEVNYVDFRNSNEVDGTILNEVSQGKNGIKIKLNDQIKALQWLGEHMDLATQEQKLRIEKLKLEVSKLNGDDKNKQKGNLDELIQVFKRGPVK